MIRVLYQNIKGLRPESLDTYSSLITSKQYDIIFVSETWFQQCDTYKSLQCFLCDSILQVHEPRPGRPNDGLLALVRPELKSSIKIISRASTHIIVQINNLTLAGVYFPPRLDDLTMQLACDEISSLKPQLILGDINIDYNKEYLLSAYRQQSHSKWISLQSMLRITKLCHINLAEKWDHVFSLPELIQETKVLKNKQDPNIRSDHNALKVIIKDSLRLETPTNNTTGPLRFNLKLLSDPLKVMALNMRYNRIIIPLFDDFLAHISPQASREDKEQLVNSLDDLLYTNLQHILTKMIGTYNTSDIDKCRFSRSQASIKNAKSMQDTIRLLRRSKMHASHNKKLEPSSNQDLMSEVVDHYQAIYTFPEELSHLKSDEKPNLPCANTDSIMHDVHPLTLEKAIKQYASSK
jgi:hypothetical protein